MNKKILLGVFGCMALFLSACSNKTSRSDDSSLVSGISSPGTAEEFANNVPNSVYFDFDSSKISESAESRLAAQIAWAKTYQGTKFLLEGNCDRRGTAEYNLALGQARANSVEKYFVKSGIEASRLAARSNGKERASGSTESECAKDRNVTTTVSAS